MHTHISFQWWDLKTVRHHFPDLALYRTFSRVYLSFFWVRSTCYLQYQIYKMFISMLLQITHFNQRGHQKLHTAALRSSLSFFKCSTTCMRNQNCNENNDKTFFFFSYHERPHAFSGHRICLMSYRERFLAKQARAECSGWGRSSFLDQKNWHRSL